MRTQFANHITVALQQFTQGHVMHCSFAGVNSASGWDADRADGSASCGTCMKVWLIIRQLYGQWREHRSSWFHPHAYDHAQLHIPITKYTVHIRSVTILEVTNESILMFMYTLCRGKNIRSGSKGGWMQAVTYSVLLWSILDELCRFWRYLQPLYTVVRRVFVDQVS